MEARRICWWSISFGANRREWKRIEARVFWCRLVSLAVDNCRWQILHGLNQFKWPWIGLICLSKKRWKLVFLADPASHRHWISGRGIKGPPLPSPLLQPRKRSGCRRRGRPWHPPWGSRPATPLQALETLIIFEVAPATRPATGRYGRYALTG